MINSMTGYGGAEAEIAGVTYSVELKSVNNRYFKTVIKLPESAAFLEEDIEKLLRRSLLRGTISYSLRVKNAPVDVLFSIDEAALKSVVDKLSRIALSGDGTRRIDIAGLLGLPGIILPASPDKQLAGQIRQGVLRITHEAVDRLKQARAAEGAALAADLKGHCEIISRELEQISARNAGTLQEYHNRLKKKVDDLLADVKFKLDEETLAREVAVFAERSDISEELARLSFHLEEFVRACAGDSGAGRRLEFISQEMLREANTIASKACDNDITRRVVEIKCEIDRLKEQVQNIE
ncbi:MAG TPA: YicC/YloC family endoribonuclease [Sedimentisphaerales bacterium]|nr:YicC/YloC family endoribonuclease [Sedimentisphaerales bacterium]